LEEEQVRVLGYSLTAAGGHIKRATKHPFQIKLLHFIRGIELIISHCEYVSHKTFSTKLRYLSYLLCVRRRIAGAAVYLSDAVLKRRGSIPVLRAVESKRRTVVLLERLSVVLLTVGGSINQRPIN
jgi:hypothetical protein